MRKLFLVAAVALTAPAFFVSGVSADTTAGICNSIVASGMQSAQTCENMSCAPGDAACIDFGLPMWVETEICDLVRPLIEMYVPSWAQPLFRAVADLSHPNLVPLYELGCHEGLWYFTMERVDGVGLLEVYAGGYIGHGLNLIVPYLLLIVVLMVRPYGLFGKEVIERV